MKIERWPPSQDRQNRIPVRGNQHVRGTITSLRGHIQSLSNATGLVVQTRRFTCGTARVASSQDRMSDVKFVWKSRCLDPIYPLRNDLLINQSKNSIENLRTRNQSTIFNLL